MVVMVGIYVIYLSMCCIKVVVEREIEIEVGFFVIFYIVVMDEIVQCFFYMDCIVVDDKVIVFRCCVLC